MGKTILYIHEEPPAPAPGCPIVIFRHLTRLSAEGWNVVIAASEEHLRGAKVPAAWKVVRVPGRRFWWPPYKGILTPSHRVRLWCEGREIQRQLGDTRPDFLLTFLYRRYPLLAAHLKRRWNLPLGVFIYDEREVWIHDPAIRDQLLIESDHILKAADRAWTVSPEMAEIYQAKTSSKDPSKYTNLMPIPEGTQGAFAAWRPEFAQRPVVAHAGVLYDFHVPIFDLLAPALARLGGELLIICQPGTKAIEELKSRHANIRSREFMPSRECLEFLRREASCTLAIYAFDLATQPWARGSFPSKFVEHSHLGIPQMLIAPPGTAIHNWAVRNEWPLLVDELSPDRMHACLSQLTGEHSWTSLANRSRALAQGDFNAEMIHAGFVATFPAKS